MKKLMALVLAATAGLALQAASAGVEVKNDTGNTFYVKTLAGKVVKLFPGDTASFCYSNVQQFNVMVKPGPGHKKVTVCTIKPMAPMVPGGTVHVRVDQIMSPTVSGGCYSYYPYMR